MSKRIDCILINPGSTRAVYQGLAADLIAIEPPSMAAMFATYLRLKGLSVVIIDQPAQGYSAEQVAAVVTEDFEPTLVVLVVYGFQPSASTQNLPAAGAIAAAVKALRPDFKIMMTGTHPAALPARTLQEEAIDFVCSGEGPPTIRHLVSALKAGAGVALVPDLYYRFGDVVMRTPAGPLLTDLDGCMPGAAWDLLPMEKYRAHNWHCFEDIDNRQPYVSMHTSLGCPHKCSFCCINAPFGGPSYRMWSPSIVGAELERLVTDYGVCNVKFVDEMFVLNREHVIGICDEIDRRGLGSQLNIWCYSRPDTVKDGFLDRLRGSGFRWLALGIESASKHVRDGAEKGRFGNEQIIATVRRIQSAGINVIGNYIFGLPDDTGDSMQDTLDMALEANCEFANFYSAMAYPGSQLYRQAIEKGWPLPTNWSGYSQHSADCLPLPTETLTSAQVLAFRDYAFQAYFRDKSYLDMVAKKFGQPVVDHLWRMVNQPLERKLLG